MAETGLEAQAHEGLADTPHRVHRAVRPEHYDFWGMDAARRGLAPLRLQPQVGPEAFEESAMGFELLKRDKGDKSSKLESKLDTKSKGETLKKSNLGKDFATQEQALKPTTDKGKGKDKDKKGKGLKETIGGLVSSVSQKLSGGPKSKPMSDEAAREYWQLTKKEIGQEAKVAEMMDKYGDLIEVFAKKENATEMVEFYNAMKDGWAPEDIYATFIRPGSMMELNLPGREREALVLLAEQGKYAEMDFTKVAKVNISNFQEDTLYRIMHDTDTMREVFKRISGVTAPEKIGGVY